ncbi:MAG: hypothetical protein JWO38_46 [Gemmataceae bacterium]|nr:hypothetical protein [Gemmataceae bacterium]
MTILLQLEAPGLEALQKEAADLGVTVEQLAHDIIRQHLRARATGSAVADTAFRRATADSVRENEELLRRLAR